MAAVTTVSLKLAEIKLDPELQCRANGVNRLVAREYANAMLGGATFEPVVVYRDGKGINWLADGFHRCAAAGLAFGDLAEISAIVHQGGRKDALVAGAGSNSAHGLRRSHADRRRAIELVLAAYPSWSDRKIGDKCGVDGKTVKATRDRLANGSSTRAEKPQDPYSVALSRFENLLIAVPTAKLGAFQAAVTEAISRAASE